MQIRCLERGLSRSFKKVNFFSFRPYIIRMSLVCTRMSSVCNSHVLVCHPYVTRMYSYVIHMSLVCHPYVTPMYYMSSVCHLYVLVYHPYVARMYSYVILTSLAWSFSMNLNKVYIYFFSQPSFLQFFVYCWYSWRILSKIRRCVWMLCVSRSRQWKLLYFLMWDDLTCH